MLPQPEKIPVRGLRPVATEGAQAKRAPEVGEPIRSAPPSGPRRGEDATKRTGRTSEPCDQIADAEARGRSDARIAKAKQLLREAPERRLPPGTHQQEEWSTDARRTAADVEIAKILGTLEEISPSRDD